MYLKHWLLLSLIFACLLSWSQAKNDSAVFTTYRYESGAKSSEGYLNNGKPDGYWKSFYRSGELKSEGNRKEYLLDGVWKFYDQQGEQTLEINYVAGKKEGVQKYIKREVVRKEELFKNDRQEGFTKVYNDKAQLIKEIPFIEGVAHGRGYGYDTKGVINTLFSYRQGKITKKREINRKDEQNQKQGVWMEFHANRNVKIEGLYINNLKHAYWKYYRSNGNLLRVEKWVMGELQDNAQETVKIEVRQKFDPLTGTLSAKGAFREGVPVGLHKEYNSKGEIIASKIYEEGILLFEGLVDEKGWKQGYWKEFYKDGELKAEGFYKDNLKTKKWKYYYADKSLEQIGLYQHGMANGNWVWFYPNGDTLRVEEYFKGKEEGRSVEYNDSGKVIAQGDYLDGLKEGAWFFEMNDHREIGKYFEGERTGRWVYYFLGEDEVISFEGDYENGQGFGMHIWYYPNGKVKKRGKYSGGKKEGIWEYFNVLGERVVTIEYEANYEIKYNGERIKYGRKYGKIMEREGFY